MISTILTANITNITELKKNPVELSKSKETCVLSNGKPCFYSVSPERMAELLATERESADLDLSLYTAYDAAISAIDLVDPNLNPDLFYLLEQIIICYIGDEKFNEVKSSKNIIDNVSDVIGHKLASEFRKAFNSRRSFLRGNIKTYIIRKRGTNIVKIGKSIQVDKRVKIISMMSGCELDVIAIIDKNIESAMHKRFSHIRGVGEWFHDDSLEIQDFVNKGEQWIIEKLTSEGVI